MIEAMMLWMAVEGSRSQWDTSIRLDPDEEEMEDNE